MTMFTFLFKQDTRHQLKHLSHRHCWSTPADSVLNRHQPAQWVKPPKNLQAVASRKTPVSVTAQHYQRRRSLWDRGTRPPPQYVDWGDSIMNVHPNI